MSNTHQPAVMRPTASEDSPFGIGAVAHITGIPEATLRVWERRYSFPSAQRTTGGHRQYTQQEVLQLLWVKMRMDDGLRTGRAIRDRQLSRRGDAVAATLHEELPGRQPPDETLVALQRAILDALLAFNSDGADNILTTAVARNPLDRVALEVVGPTLAAIGDAWCSEKIGVATEHYASNFLRHQLLGWMRTSPPPYQVRPIVLACAPGEFHEGSLLMLGVLLRRLRWPVLYLGQTLPVSELAELVNQTRPALIVFVAMSEAAALALANWPTWLNQRPENEPENESEYEATLRFPIIGYGGRAFTENPALAELVPGALLGTTLYEGSQRIHRLMLDLNVLEQ